MAMKELLSTSDKMLPHAHGLLARLWRLVLFELHITPAYWTHSLDKYSIAKNNGIENTPHAIRNYRNNISRQLADTDITFNKFIEGLKIIGVIRFKLTITLYHKNREITEHSVSMDTCRHNIDIEKEFNESNIKTK